MTLKNTGPSLEKIAKTLAGVRDSREFLLKNTREVIVLCSQAIIAIHRGDVAAAQKNLGRADMLLKRYRKKSAGHLARYMITPEQEFVEASALISIYQKKQIPSHTRLAVMPESYVLGLLDCIGELKRMTFDRIRTGEIAEAARIFGVMEGMYLQLQTFALYDKVVKEARRKLDVCRILVDDVRAAITEESRRAELIRALDSR
ncbi:MAG: RNA-binding protein [Nitrosopumilus sp. H8]|nr:MAG: RNA-binding protein [Nitrosopumilus sp. H13]RNJ78676.1 MAG: RNA-binding protein [Nitrosopumilus sp. H8]